MNRFSVRSGLLATVLILGGLMAGPAQAAVIFSDNFDSETLGLNYNSFANWTVADGTVDAIGNGFFDFLPGNGVYVDLDGSTFDAGVLTSNALSLAAGSYSLAFDIAGSQRGQTSVVTVSVGTSANPTQFGSTVLTLASSDPFSTVSLGFAVGSATNDFHISFANDGGDNIGALLDRVVLSSNAVPEPASLAMMGLGGLGVVGFARLRRKRVG